MIVNFVLVRTLCYSKLPSSTFILFDGINRYKLLDNFRVSLVLLSNNNYYFDLYINALYQIADKK